MLISDELEKLGHSIMLESLDPIIKSLAASSGIGLIGMLLVRTTARGGWKIMGFEPGPIVEPQMKKWAVALTWIFATVAFLGMLRGY